MNFNRFGTEKIKTYVTRQRIDIYTKYVYIHIYLLCAYLQIIHLNIWTLYYRYIKMVIMTTQKSSITSIKYAIKREEKNN